MSLKKDWKNEGKGNMLMSTKHIGIMSALGSS